MNQAPTSGIIYLDESGDLGWNFTAPYRSGGSSRHLTIAALCVFPKNKHIPKRVIRDMYAKFRWPTSVERKWADMSSAERSEFAARARAMCDKYPDISLHAIIVKKQNVQEHIRNDSNKLYNYMIRLSILDRMAAFDSVTLVPDPRSIKVKSGNSLHDYLLTELWFEKKVKTNLTTNPCDSKNCAGIQFTDMLAGLVQARFEDNCCADFRVLHPKMKLSCLFFP